MTANLRHWPTSLSTSACSLILALLLAGGCGEATAPTGGADDPDRHETRSAALTADGWRHRARLVSPESFGGDDSFGRFVRVDGDRALVGDSGFNRDTDGDNTPEEDVGAVFGFERNDRGWQSSEKLDLPNPTPGYSSQTFGYQMALDGDTLAVTAASVEADVDGDGSQEDFGAVFVFRRVDGSWKKQSRITAPKDSRSKPNRPLFGSSLAVSGDTLLVGAFGKAADVNNDSIFEPEVGAVFVYRREQGVWKRQATLTPDDRVRGQRFGRSVALDETTALIGASGDRNIDDDPKAEFGVGAAHVFERNEGSWAKSTRLTLSEPRTRDRFGRHIALGEDFAAVAAPSRRLDVDGDGNRERRVGVVSLFRRSDGNFNHSSTFSHPSKRPDWEFGAGGLALDGERTYVGAPQWSRSDQEDGGVFVFDNSTSPPEYRGAVTHPRDEKETDFATTFDTDGSSLVVGASGENIDVFGNGSKTVDVGAAHVFELDADDDGIRDADDNCPKIPNSAQSDEDGDGAGEACDRCPEDNNKQRPGRCGCGTKDEDSDGDGTPDCNDSCPSNANKTVPGACGCNVPDRDSDGDGLPDCVDRCPNQSASPGGADGGTVGDGCPADAGSNPGNTDSGGCSTGSPTAPLPLHLLVLLVGVVAAAGRSRPRRQCRQ